MIDAKAAKQLVEKAIIDNKVKRLEKTKLEYAIQLKDLETKIRDKCSEEGSTLELPINGWPKDVDFERLAEVLQSYHYRCIILDDGPSRAVGLRIAW